MSKFTYNRRDTGLTWYEGEKFSVFVKTIGGVVTPYYFEHNDYGDEYAGGLFFEDVNNPKSLTDYDGIMGYLPDEVVEIIVWNGFTVGDQYRNERIRGVEFPVEEVLS